MQIAVITIPVREQARARAFYEETLRFRIVGEGAIHGDRNYVLMSPPAGVTAISLMLESERMPAGSAQGTILQTLDVENEYNKLTRRGLQLSPITEAPWGRFTAFADPDGNGWLIAEARS